MLRPWQVRQCADDFPNFRPIVNYEAAIPVYEAYVEVRLLRKQDLSPLERMALACVQNGVATVEAMEIVLGVTRPLVRSAVATMMGVDLLTMREVQGHEDSRRLFLTDRGSETVASNSLQMPAPATVKIIYDGLLGRLTPLLRYQYINRRDVEVRRLHVLPAAYHEPTVTDLDRDALRRYLKDLARIDPKRAPQGELHDIIEITGVVKLFRPVDVLAFDAEDRSEITFRLFDGDLALKDYGEKLGALYRKVPDVLPFVRRSEEEVIVESELAIGSLLDESLVRQADEVQSELDQVSRVLATGERTGEPVIEEMAGDDAIESPSPPAAASRTKEELTALRARKAELEKQLTSVRTVSALEHAALLEKALTASRKRVIIVSPWLSDDVIDRSFMERMEKALKRGVDILVCWGMPPRTNPSPDEERKERRSERFAEKLKLLQKQRTKGSLRVVRLGNTHEKILVVDRKFALVTSFNFLSFRGDPSRGFRQETGLYHEIPDKVDELAQEILGRAAFAEDTGNTMPAGGGEQATSPKGAVPPDR